MTRTPAQDLAIFAAATNLRLKLWPRGENHETRGCIGVGQDTLHVYFHTDRHPQYVEPFCEFHGYRVEWHFTGPFVAGNSASADAIVIDDPYAP